MIMSYAEQNQPNSDTATGDTKNEEIDLLEELKDIDLLLEDIEDKIAPLAL